MCANLQLESLLIILVAKLMSVTQGHHIMLFEQFDRGGGVVKV
jgi:hypothetical protein